MAVNAVTMLLMSLTAVCPQLALSEHHSGQDVVSVMCLNETHHAIQHHDNDHVDEDDEDDEDDMNTSRRLAMHDMMNMSDWIVMETTDALDPCGSEACNSTCNATSCHPMACVVPVPTTTVTAGPVTTDAAMHAAYAGVVSPMLASLLAYLSS
eukprot:1508874-Amphidinium_carterae.1